MTDRRLAFFLQDLRGGGAEIAVVRLVNGIARRGYGVDLVVISDRGPYRDRLDPAVRLVVLGGRTATACWSLARYLDRARPEALIATMTHVNVAAVLARRLARHRPRLIVVEHNRFERNFARKSGLVRLAYRLTPALYRSADVVAGVSEGVRQSIAAATGLPLQRITVLANPVVSADLARRAAEPVDDPRFAAGAPPVILAVGRLTRQKNYPLLLEAFAALRARRPASLVILGTGELEGELKARATALPCAADIAFLGFRDNPYAYMARAAVFVMSSDWEGLPTVLIEALACGTPVVSTDCESGPAEILDNGRFGRLVQPGDAAALAQALAATLDDPGPAEPRLARAQDYAEETAIDRYLSAALPGTGLHGAAEATPRAAAS